MVYRAGAKAKIQGFPLPLAFFVWEKDRWTDFVPPAFMQITAATMNVLSGIALFTAPVAIFSRIRRANQATDNGSGSV